MNVKQRERLLLLGAGLVVALLVGDKLVFTPLTKAWKNRAQRIQTLERSLSGSEIQLRREKEFRAEWEEKKRRALPANVSVAENLVLKAVDRWAKASRVNLTSLKPQWKTGDPDHTILECRAEAVGNLQAIARFIYELEMDTLALRVDGLDLSARDKEGQQMAVGVRFSGLLLLPDKK